MALVEKFTNSNVQWLEEMAKFAEVAPPANQLMVTAINAQAALPGPGTASNLRGGTLTSPVSPLIKICLVGSRRNWAQRVLPLNVAK